MSRFTLGHLVLTQILPNGLMHRAIFEITNKYYEEPYSFDTTNESERVTHIRSGLLVEVEATINKQMYRQKLRYYTQEELTTVTDRSSFLVQDDHPWFILEFGRRNVAEGLVILCSVSITWQLLRALSRSAVEALLEDKRQRIAKLTKELEKLKEEERITEVPLAFMLRTEHTSNHVAESPSSQGLVPIDDHP